MDDYAMQMRWADLDQLGHVNNVSYVRYADEARRELAARGEIDGELHIGRCDVEFLLPMHLSLQPIYVTGRIDGDRLIQEICHRHDGEPNTGEEQTTYARVTTDLVAERSPIAAGDSGAEAHPLPLRRGDALDGVVGNAGHFELFQETRILTMAGILHFGTAGGFVVARVAVDYAADLPWRSTPYGVVTWVERFGRSSIQLMSEIRDGDTVCARAEAVLVGFDAERQKSRPLNDQERTRLAQVAHQRP